LNASIIINAKVKTQSGAGRRSRRREAESRRQKAESRRQKAEGRRQKAKGKKQ